MTTVGTFSCFNDLPTELRLMIWKFYFGSARLHVVHPAPESEHTDPMKEVLSYCCTVLDPLTNFVFQDAHPPSPLISREARDVFLSLNRAWDPVRFGSDTSESVISHLPDQFNWLDHFADLLSSFQRTERNASERPVYVDWGRDMLYICDPQTEQAVWALRNAPWRRNVRRLAFLVAQNEFSGAILFGPFAPIREILEVMTGLKELFVVLIPQTETAASAGVAGLPRDAFGFVPYANYLKVAGLAADHMWYNRAASIIRKAMNSMPKQIKLERVVDVDFLAGSFGRYQRRAHLIG
ncbi:hypothetical protein F4804DRAFT_30392 [Jackrogersella minutella]|nr:hypothetical protein F4804DRAFT_30392 [Jackrogersella minutella]